MSNTERTGMHLAVLLGLGALQFLVLLGYGDLWDIDEGMHALLASNMLRTGDWITPVFNGEAFLDKPPLYNWLVAMSFRLLGETEFAARAPAALAGIGCAITTYFIGRRAYGPTAGFYAAVILITSLMFAIVSRIVQYDVPFVFFTTLALYFFGSALPGERGNRNRILWLYVACALAVLIKGPIGVILPGGAIAVFILVQRRFSLLGELRIPVGVALFLVIVTPWFFLMEKANPGYLHYFIVRQHFANIFGAAELYVARHSQPWYFYLPVLFAALLPWAVFLPQSLWRAARRGADDNHDFSMLFVIWILVILLILSLAESKLMTYLLPVLPAAALLIGRYVCALVETPGAAIRRSASLGLLSGLLLWLAVVGYIVAADPWPTLTAKYGLEPAELNTLIAGFVSLFGVATLALLLRRQGLAIGMLATFTSFFVFYATVFMVPDMTPYRSSREIGLAYDRILPPGEKMLFCGQTLDCAMFYTGRESINVPDARALERHLADGQSVIVRTDAAQCAGVLTDSRYSVERYANKAIVTEKRR